MTDTTKPNTAPTFLVGDGSLAITFGTASTDRTTDIDLQPDGKILQAGYSDGKFALARFNADGTLDTTFSGDGKLAGALGATTATAGITYLSGGKLLASSVSGGYATFARYLDNGSLDTTFGTNGTLKLGTSSNINTHIAVLGDGRILTTEIVTGAQQFVIIHQYNANGTPDTAFGEAGKATVGIGPDDHLENILVQPDGKILLDATTPLPLHAAHNLIRLNADGTLDTGFSGDGRLPLSNDMGNLGLTGAMAVQTDGKIILGGVHDNPGGRSNLILYRYNADGTLDTTFNTTGSVSLPANTSMPDSVQAVAVQGDGKILAVDQITGADLSTHVIVVRFLANGTLDTTFGKQGIVDTVVPRDTTLGTVNPKALLIQPDGKILVSGDAGADTGSDFAMLRYNTDGSLDQTFSPPVNTLDGAPTFKEAGYGGAFPVVLDNNVTIVDAELAAANSYNGASLTLKRHAGASADDLFSAREGGTLSTLAPDAYFSVDGVTVGRVTANAAGTLTLTFGANATQALVNKALQQIAYANKSDTPPANVQIDWTFSDGNTGSQGTGGALATSGSTTVTITATNDAPVLKQAVPDQTIATGAAFSFAIPASTFSDPDHDTLTYSISMVNGTALPPWLAFDAATGTLSGTPDTIDTGTFFIRVLAKDPGGATAQATFNLVVQTSNNHVDGTAGSDNLVGTDGNDILQGFAGNDTLDGKGGADVLTGGDGNDGYFVDNTGDVVSEAGTAAGGTDTVFTTLASYVLPSNVEHGRVLADGAANLTGNELANTLYAGNGDNVLDGALGTDTVSYQFATSAVTISLATTQAQDTEGSGIDTVRNVENLIGSNYDDNLLGNQGDNTLSGGAGADLMVGGNGSDTYVVDNAGDLVRETNTDRATGGTDTVVTSISYTLGANVENLTQTGTGNISATGNALDNKIVGNSGNNIMNAGAGADTLSGGLGNDTLIGAQGKDVLEGGAGNDVFVLKSASDTGTTSAGWDVVKDFVRGQDKIDLSTLDANTATGANDAFTGFMAGTAAFTAAGQLKFADGVLYGNTDADADAEFAIQLTGITALAASDVVL